MGGELTVESAPGQGARFILEVPADLLAAAPTAPRDV
jgi:signal transduction histidine kinase